MKKVASLISFLFLTLYAGSQTINNPHYEKKDNSNIGILEIEKTSSNTVIHFVYQSDDVFVDGGWANVNPDIKIKDANGYKTYNLIKAQGIPIAPDKKRFDFAGQWFSFKLTFPRIAYSITEIDIIECESSNCFNFYGVSLFDDSDDEHRESGTFRRDYNKICFYDNDTEEWSDWKDGDNTFVMNYNDNGDIAHYKPNGDVALYKKISDVEESETGSGEKFQIISALDEEGIRFKFQFFNDPSIGLKLIYNNLMIQFSKN